jgi:hypothetical protein
MSTEKLRGRKEKEAEKPERRKENYHGTTEFTHT